MAVTDDAILKIKGMILDGELRPGDRLPPEKELSDRLGLSRNSLREAVKALEVIRVLDVRRGDGTYVTSLSPDVLLETLSFVLDLQQDASILDAMEVRRLLEPRASVLAVERGGAELAETLRGILDEVDLDTEVAELVAHDAIFHSTIAEAAGNPYLARLLESLSTQTHRARIWRGLTQANAVERTLAEHRAIVDAIAIGDRDLVHATAMVHVCGVEDWLRANVAGMPADADPATESATDAAREPSDD